MRRASQLGLLRQPALKNVFESNLTFDGFHEVNRITGRAGTARDTSEIITFGEKGPEATLLLSLWLRGAGLNRVISGPGNPRKLCRLSLLVLLNK